MYLNLTQIAESFGVSESVVEGWIRHEGLPHTPDRGVLLFDRAQVAQWALIHGLTAQAGFLAPETPSVAAPLRVGPLLRVGGIWRDVAPADVRGIFARVATHLPGAAAPIRELLAKRFSAEGGVTLALTGGGYALPHPCERVTLGRESGVVALILLNGPLPPQEHHVDDLPVTRLFFFVAPSPRTHLNLIGRLGRLLSRKTLSDVLARGGTDDEILHEVDAADAEPDRPRKPAVTG